MRAYPTNKSGEKIGATQYFTQNQWSVMLQTFGKKLRWKAVIEQKNERKRRSETGFAVTETARRD